MTDPGLLAALAREALRSGALPRVMPADTDWMRLPSSSRCTLCNERFDGRSLVTASSHDGRPIDLHTDCFAAWIKVVAMGGN